MYELRDQLWINILVYFLFNAAEIGTPLLKYLFESFDKQYPK